MTINFSKAQWNEMTAIITQIIIIINQNAPQARPAEIKPSQFRSRNIDYFDSNSQAAPIKVKNTHNIYHNVFNFINRLRIKITIMKTITLRQNVEFCLLRAVDDWYTNQLTHINKIKLRNDSNGVKKWCDALKIKFRDSSKKSLILLKAIRYIIKNARNKKNSINYVFNIVLNNKNVNIIIIDVA